MSQNSHSDSCEQTAFNMFLIQMICKKDQGTTTTNKKYSLKSNKTSVKILTNVSLNMLWTLDISVYGPLLMCVWFSLIICNKDQGTTTMFNHQDQWHPSINRLNRLNQKVEKTVTFLDCIGQMMTLFSRHNLVIIMRSKRKESVKKYWLSFYVYNVRLKRFSHLFLWYCFLDDGPWWKSWSCTVLLRQVSGTFCCSWNY